MDWLQQDGFDLRFDWGTDGIERVGHSAGTIVIVDVLRFTSAVETGVSHGLGIYPYRWRDDSAREFAKSKGAILAGLAEEGLASLSPQSLASVPSGSQVVLPSPNGATCSLRAAELCATVVAGCLRNAVAVAEWLAGAPRPVVVIASGEVSRDGSFRPATEDLIGAGAILAGLTGSRSPEAEMAVAAWNYAAPRLHEVLGECASARELKAEELGGDVDWALNVDVSGAVPVLREGCFVKAAS